jgi:predicted SAM-dependent methyltransferase
VSSLLVQYGCGWIAPHDWLNFDSSPTLRFERLPIVGQVYTKNPTRFPHNVKYGDIVRGLPVPYDSVQCLYASHVLEHLAYDDALIALKNSFSILKPGGIFRLIVPDLFSRASRYIDRHKLGSPQAAEEFMDATWLGDRRRPAGILENIIATFGGNRHRWMWDEASMKAALTSAAFTNIRRCEFGDSVDARFSAVEDKERFYFGGIPEIAIECSKC